MIMNKDNIIIWLKEFKSNWLPQNISTDDRLFQLLSKKIEELEQLLNHEKVVSPEEKHECVTITSDIDQSFVSTEESHELSLFTTPPNRRIQIDDDEEETTTTTKETYSRPTIRIKRISLSEAELYLPAACKPAKSKRGRKRKTSTIISDGKKPKRNTQTSKSILSSTPDTNTSTNNKLRPTRTSTRSKKVLAYPSMSSLASTQSTNDNKKKNKRKLRAIDAEDDDLYTLGNLSQPENLNGDIECDQIPRYIGQNGILSQTRKNNESTMNIEDDCTIRSQPTKDDVITPINEIENNLETPVSTSLDDTLNSNRDIDSMNHETLVENNDNEPLLEHNDNESLFEALNLTHDKTFESSSTLDKTPIINYNDCIEDISNDGMDPPPAPTISSTTLPHLSLTT